MNRPIRTKEMKSSIKEFPNKNKLNPTMDSLVDFTNSFINSKYQFSPTIPEDARGVNPLKHILQGYYYSDIKITEVCNK